MKPTPALISLTSRGIPRGPCWRRAVGVLPTDNVSSVRMRDALANLDLRHTALRVLWTSPPLHKQLTHDRNAMANALMVELLAQEAKEAAAQALSVLRAVAIRDDGLRAAAAPFWPQERIDAAFRKWVEDNPQGISSTPVDPTIAPAPPRKPRV